MAKCDINGMFVVIFGDSTTIGSSPKVCYSDVIRPTLEPAPPILHIGDDPTGCQDSDSLAIAIERLVSRFLDTQLLAKMRRLAADKDLVAIDNLLNRETAVIVVIS